MLILLALLILAVPVFFRRSLMLKPIEQTRILDLGLFFALVVSAYGALPLIGIALADLGIGALSDNRLGGVIPAQEAVINVGLMYLLFLVGFTLCYLTILKRNTTHSLSPTWTRPSRMSVWIATAILIAIKVGLFATRTAMDIKQGSDYLGTYAELAGLPLFVQQIIGVFTATELSATILFIVVIIARNPRLHIWIGALLLLQIVPAIFGGGSRSYAFACILAYVVARSLFDRRIGSPYIFAMGGIGIFAFLTAGLIRQAMISGYTVSGLYLIQGGEFFSVFINAVDIAEKQSNFAEPLFGIGLYLVDLLRLVPQQITGDFKLDPATFYVKTFYPEFSAAGGGLAFGAIAESALGFGAREALVRGALVGCLYGLICRACLERRSTVVSAFVYTWFVVLSYHAIRDTTFSVFPRFIFQVVPILVVLRLTGVLRPALSCVVPDANTKKA